MMAESACPPGAMTGERRISHYTTFVVTQIYDQNSGCVISPNADPQAATYCAAPDPSLRAVFGYVRCDTLGQVATLNPAPRSALATKLRLVK
jgi:hypothetical protein